MNVTLDGVYRLTVGVAPIGVVMDFIEKIFGIAPDGGSGSLELALVLVPFVAVSLVTFLARRRSRRADR